MKKAYLLFFFLIMLHYGDALSQASLSEGCYQRFFKEGKAAFAELKFDLALNAFRAARICSDKPAGSDIEEWIKKAEQSRNELPLISRSENYTLKAQLAFADTAYQRAFRLNQEALRIYPGNQLAKDQLQEILDYLSFLEVRDVLAYKLSPAGAYLAVLVEKKEGARLEVIHLESRTKVLSMGKLHYDEALKYKYSYQFSPDGAYLSCFLEEKGQIRCQVFVFDGPVAAVPVHTSGPIFQYHSARFGLTGAYLAYLIEQGDKVHCQLIALEGRSASAVLTSEPLYNSGGRVYPYSFQFSEKGSYLACIAQQDDQAVCKLYALNGRQAPAMILVSEPLYEKIIRFSKNGVYLAFLINNGKKVHCRVYALEGQQRPVEVLTSEPLRSEKIHAGLGKPILNYHDSFSFDKNSRYLACMVDEGRSTRCALYALQGPQKASVILTSDPLRYTSLGGWKTGYSYRFSNQGNYLAYGIEQAGGIYCQVYALSGQQPPEVVHTFEGNNFRFSADEKYLAYLVRQDMEVRCKVVTLDGKNAVHSVFASEAIQQIEEPGKDYWWMDNSNGYYFSKSGNYLVLLMKKGESTGLKLYALDEKTPPVCVLTCESLHPGIIPPGYSSSYQFISAGKYLACLTEQGDGPLWEVFLLEKSRPARPIRSFPALLQVNSFSYQNFRFVEDQTLLTMEQEDRKTLSVYDLGGPSTRYLRDLSPITAFDLIPGRQIALYLTKDRRLKLASLQIPPDRLIDHYNWLLPPLEE